VSNISVRRSWDGRNYCHGYCTRAWFLWGFAVCWCGEDGGPKGTRALLNVPSGELCGALPEAGAPRLFRWCSLVRGCEMGLTARGGQEAHSPDEIVNGGLDTLQGHAR